MYQLTAIQRELSQAIGSDDLVTRIVRAARELIGADGATLVLRDGDWCYYAEENAISPMWKGRRFPMSACISGWVMLNKVPAIIEHVYMDARIPADAYRPTFVRSLVMVPVRRTAPIAAIGNYWGRHYSPTEEETATLELLADAVADALDSAQLIPNAERM